MTYTEEVMAKWNEREEQKNIDLKIYAIALVQMEYAIQSIESIANSPGNEYKDALLVISKHLSHHLNRIQELKKLKK
jgi:hypothetical protein